MYNDETTSFGRACSASAKSNELCLNAECVSFSACMCRKEGFGHIFVFNIKGQGVIMSDGKYNGNISFYITTN